MTNSAFSEYVSGTAFNLQLSKSQITMLVWTHVKGARTGCPLRNWYVTTGALADRGLLESRDAAGVVNGYLSRAGELVVYLLQESGQYQAECARLGLADEEVAA